MSVTSLLHCDQCHETFDVENGACPRCEGPANGSPKTPWTFTTEGWRQHRLDGTGWVWAEEGPQLSEGGVPSSELATCPSGHTYRRAVESDCPGCERLPVLNESGAPKKRSNWAVPAAVAALIVVIGVLVNFGLAGPQAEGDQEGTGTVAPTTTTPTTVPLVDSDATALKYQSEMEGNAATAEALANRAIAANTAWDDREITQDETKQLLLSLQADTQRLLEAFEGSESDAPAGTAHGLAMREGEAMLAAAEGMIQGLADPRSSRLREESLASYVTETSQLLDSTQSAIDANRSRLVRAPGSLVAWDSLLIGECIDRTDDALVALLADCPQAEAEILAVLSGSYSDAQWAAACTKVAFAYLDQEHWPVGGLWLPRPAGANNASTVCAFAAEPELPLVETPTATIWPLVIHEHRDSSEPGNRVASDLRVGDCLVGPVHEEDGTLPESISAVSCEGPFDYMVIGTGHFSAGNAYPFMNTLVHRSARYCAAQYESAIGQPYLTSPELVAGLVPSREDWNEGMRAITCLAVPLIDSETVPAIGAAFSEVTTTTTTTTSVPTTATTMPRTTTTTRAPTTTWAPTLGWVEGGCVADVGTQVRPVSCSAPNADWVITDMTFNPEGCPLSSEYYVDLEDGTFACLG